jgi:hypothetical protein
LIPLASVPDGNRVDELMFCMLPLLKMKAWGSKLALES